MLRSGGGGGTRACKLDAASAPLPYGSRYASAAMACMRQQRSLSGSGAGEIAGCEWRALLEEHLDALAHHAAGVTGGGEEGRVPWPIGGIEDDRVPLRQQRGGEREGGVRGHTRDDEVEAFERARPRQELRQGAPTKVVGERHSLCEREGKPGARLVCQGMANARRSAQGDREEIARRREEIGAGGGGQRAAADGRASRGARRARGVST
jgi:hypothetical protein